MFLLDDTSFSDRGYVAPTVFLRANTFLTRYNYYSSFNDALLKYKFLHNQGGQDVTPVGYVPFAQNGQPQTFGINVDFYAFVEKKWSLVSYAYLKGLPGYPPLLFRFYTTDGNGEYYAIFDNRYFSLAATSLTNISVAKLAELDAFYREVALLKYRYNSLVSFLNELSKQQLTPIKQQIFNEGILLVNNLNNQIHSIDGVEIIYSKDGKIGLPVLLLIAIIAILAGATAWTAADIAAEREKTRRINDAYELSKWIAAKKIELAKLVNSGQLTQSQAKEVTDGIDKAQTLANDVAKKASKETGGGLLANAATILKFSVVGYLAYLLLNKKSSSNG